MRNKTTLAVLGLCAFIVTVGIRPSFSEEEQPAATMTLTATTTFEEVIAQFGKYTAAEIEVSDEDAKQAQQYTFPPFMVGQALQVSPVADALRNLTSTGWEGSRLPAADRDRAGEPYQLTRLPYAFEEGQKKSWICNNRQWDWHWRKTPGDPAGGYLKIFSRLQPDGDVVAGKKFSLPDIKDEDALLTLLDMMKQQTGWVVNIIPEESQFNVESSAPTPEAPANKPEVRHLPMTAAAIPAELRKRLATGVTPGQFLSIITIALNQFTQSAQTDWRWSSAVDAAGKVTYTLRDYAHFIPEPQKPKPPADSKGDKEHPAGPPK